MATQDSVKKRNLLLYLIVVVSIIANRIRCPILCQIGDPERMSNKEALQTNRWGKFPLNLNNSRAFLDHWFSANLTAEFLTNLDLEYEIRVKLAINVKRALTEVQSYLKQYARLDNIDWHKKKTLEIWAQKRGLNIFMAKIICLIQGETKTNSVGTRVQIRYIIGFLSATVFISDIFLLRTAKQHRYLVKLYSK